MVLEAEMKIGRVAVDVLQSHVLRALRVREYHLINHVNVFMTNLIMDMEAAPLDVLMGQQERLAALATAKKMGLPVGGGGKRSHALPALVSPRRHSPRDPVPPESKRPNHGSSLSPPRPYVLAMKQQFTPPGHNGIARRGNRAAGCDCWGTGVTWNVPRRVREFVVDIWKGSVLLPTLQALLEPRNSAPNRAPKSGFLQELLYKQFSAGIRDQTPVTSMSPMDLPHSDDLPSESQSALLARCASMLGAEDPQYTRTSSATSQPPDIRADLVSRP